jgi:hypothetical protein
MRSCDILSIMPRRSGATAILAVAAGMLIFGAGTANAACPTPRILKVYPAFIAGCGTRCTGIAVNWAGSSDCDHYNIRERLGRQFEAPGKDRGQLTNNRSASFGAKFFAERTVHVSMQGCTRNVVGASSCSRWSDEVSYHIADRSPKAKACETYAQRAVGVAKLARDTYKCDPKVISGPRWTADLAQHRSWCIDAEPKIANFEDRERFRISQQCRVDAGKAQGGKARIAVVSQKGDTFIITGSGFAPNAPVIIRLSGPGASIATVTIVSGQRLKADAKGNISLRLFGAQICKRGGGDVTFTAEDQDNAKSPPVTSKCAP